MKEHGQLFVLASAPNESTVRGLAGFPSGVGSRNLPVVRTAVIHAISLAHDPRRVGAFCCMFGIKTE